MARYLFIMGLLCAGIFYIPAFRLAASWVMALYVVLVAGFFLYNPSSFIHGPEGGSAGRAERSRRRGRP